MTDKELQELFDRYLAGNASEDDKALLETWYLHKQHTNRFIISEKESVHDLDLVWASIQNNITKPKVKPLWPRIAAAASIIFIVSAVGYFLLKKQLPDQKMQNVAADIKPGGNKAVLLLDNGRQIKLTDAPNGLLAQQGASSINKSTDGLISYKEVASAPSIPVVNTLLTPRGGQYHLILSDGTNVWLNSASSIKYPTVFSGTDRTVEITGEAYFEVAHNASKSFKVNSRGQTVTVLGTHFDVNTYADEPAVKTTLLEGSVRVDAGIKNITIKPGQESVFTKGRFIVNQVDTEDAIAWKNGMFRFNEESLESIMRKLSRWYNVEVEYKSEEVKRTPLTGIITHFNTISRVLRMLELTNKVKFKVEGQKIIVTKP